MTVCSGACAFWLIVGGQVAAVGMAMLWLRSKADVPCPCCDGTGIRVRSGRDWMAMSECQACRGTGVMGR